MTVVKFPPPAQAGEKSGSWSAAEMESLLQLFRELAGSAGAREWAVGLTEADDPQFYVLGTGPDADTLSERECLLCLSRVGRLYLLEDGRGIVLGEDVSLSRLSETAVRLLGATGKTSYLSRLLVVFCTYRMVLEQKLEPVLADSSDLLLRLSPQLAVLA